MADINTIAISGRLGQDPKEVCFDSGGVKATFSLAVNRWNGEKEETDWFSCEAVSNNAKYILKNAKQGDGLFVEGQLRTKEYTQKETLVKVKSTYIRVQNVKISKKSDKAEEYQDG